MALTPQSPVCRDQVHTPEEHSSFFTVWPLLAGPALVPKAAIQGHTTV